MVPNEKYSRVDKTRANSGGIATKFFTGRGEILEKLSLFFSKRENNLVPRREFLLYGMGGVGKTQIALKFRQLMDAEERYVGFHTSVLLVFVPYFPLTFFHLI